MAIDVTRIERDLQVLRQHGTGPVSDSLDLLGVNGGLQGIGPLFAGAEAVGPAYTLAYREVAPGEPGPAGDFIDDVPPGSVVVIANGGRTYCTVWGGILTTVAKNRGLAGTVIDGCCRDVDEIVEQQYPMFSRGRYMKSGKNRVRLAAVQVDVAIANVTVQPGDIVCADASGVIVVPFTQLEAVSQLVTEIAAMEAGVVNDVTSGVTLRDARERRGYSEVAVRRGA